MAAVFIDTLQWPHGRTRQPVSVAPRSDPEPTHESGGLKRAIAASIGIVLVFYGVLGGVANVSLLSGLTRLAEIGPSYVVGLFALPLLALILGLMFLRGHSGDAASRPWRLLSIVLGRVLLVTGTCSPSQSNSRANFLVPLALPVLMLPTISGSTLAKPVAPNPRLKRGRALA